METTKNLAEAIRRKLASDSDLAAAVDDERFNVSVGSAIHEARTRAGLTQQKLAERIGMHQSAIARLENADYSGHSLKTLQRIAGALGNRIEIVFVEQSAIKYVVSTEEFSVEIPEWNTDSMSSWQLLDIDTTGLLPRHENAVA